MTSLDEAWELINNEDIRRYRSAQAYLTDMERAGVQIAYSGDTHITMARLRMNAERAQERIKAKYSKPGEGEGVG